MFMKNVGKVIWAEEISNFKVGDLVVCKLRYNNWKNVEYFFSKIVRLDYPYIRLESWSYGYNLEDENLKEFKIAKIE